ncbi:hypothetical protein BCR43DRAFT_530440 [Syncephalastrum racemosum]|uniref:Late embryogenesis abundant protein LEA-2 subgroup domain-containing protein n=1 Tax=Syncephalastrum racemosum TaxID=13706 RepID=A0A1X2HL95_SYNRA|nr:hypothetical protein BCR43DRAFT_530440 [Syncephalastrum racemosum]
MPTIDFAGVTESPESNGSAITYDGSTFNINLGLTINIKNPNVLPLRLSDINATATIPTNDGLSADLGGGWMDYQYVPSNSDFNFTYPFAIKYDPTTPSGNEMLNTLIDKCGLNGGDPQDINIYYTIHLVAKVLFVTVHPTITSSASFACPLKSGGLPGLSTGALTDIFGSSSD